MSTMRRQYVEIGELHLKAIPVASGVPDTIKHTVKQEVGKGQEEAGVRSRGKSGQWWEQ